MKTPFLITSLLFIIVFSACKSEKKAPVSSQKTGLNDFMVGTWETEYISIKYKTYQKSDSTYTFEEDFSNQQLGKAQSIYKNDGTFSSWFLTSEGEKAGLTHGKWNSKKDSLFIDYTYGGRDVKAWYSIKQTPKGFEGNVTYDWDNDGEYDDALFMITKRLK